MTTCCVSLWKKAIAHFPGNIRDPTFCLRKEIFDCSHLYIFCSGRHLVDSVSFSTSFPTTTLCSSSMMTLKSGSFIKDTQSIFKSWPQIVTWRTKMTLFQLRCSGLGIGRASSLAAVHSLLLSAEEHNTPQVQNSIDSNVTPLMYIVHLNCHCTFLCIMRCNTSSKVHPQLDNKQ